MSKSPMQSHSKLGESGEASAEIRIGDALKIIRDSQKHEKQNFKIFLSCGFTPLHFSTFLEAHLIKLDKQSGQKFSIETGLYGDLESQFKAVQIGDYNACAVILEWSDFDSRLGLRSSAGWSSKVLEDIEQNVSSRVNWFADVFAKVGKKLPLILSLPTLPFPPVSFGSPVRAEKFEVQIVNKIRSLLLTLDNSSKIKISSETWIDQKSPLAERWDLKSELNSGFPYTLQHASRLANQIANLLKNSPPKKGLITDLDDTLWHGILGEVGSDGVSWDLNNHSQMHGLYQQLLNSLAETGTLLGIASKNERANVSKALERKDLLVSPKKIFPIEAHWNPKSESVGRILKTWNIGATDVVFIDDSPMELAQVKSAFPDIECILFPKDENEGLLVLRRLREIFGKDAVTEEDGLRLESIRNRIEFESTSLERSSPMETENFLKGAEAVFNISFSKEPMPPRALELINKTNQFNLNGRRLEEVEWNNYCGRGDTVVARISFKDKYGPLGTIAVVAGHVAGNRLTVVSWVMSCRAFARRIEHQCLAQLFKYANVDEIEFEYTETPKNGPTAEFLSTMLGEPVSKDCIIKLENFNEKCLPLYHEIELGEPDDGSREQAS